MSLRASYLSHGTGLVEEPFLRAAVTIIVACMVILGEVLLFFFQPALRQQHGSRECKQVDTLLILLMIES
ncbi:hypothetical protein BDZ85DRAFT_264649 [Elsinoe ampelina]|uniref:Uncharacterized protein n=1 Tax=Elsinoe ampelina TaxID=302913 RepID=A0A6A6G9A2_9PEZI|nr:hypothetical protein BDZ85DRAFT_264649 [Elsinoe ampelina]